MSMFKGTEGADRARFIAPAPVDSVRFLLPLRRGVLLVVSGGRSGDAPPHSLRLLERRAFLRPSA